MWQGGGVGDGVRRRPKVLCRRCAAFRLSVPFAASAASAADVHQGAISPLVACSVVETAAYHVFCYRSSVAPRAVLSDVALFPAESAFLLVLVLPSSRRRDLCVFCHPTLYNKA